MSRKSTKSKECFKRKFLYNLPRESCYYLMILKNYQNFYVENEYIILKTKNIYTYFTNHKKNKLFLLNHFKCDNDFNIDFLSQYAHESGSRNLYNISSPIEDLYSKIEKTLFTQSSKYKFNKTNEMLTCNDCFFNPQKNEELFQHLLDCKIYQHTLFGEEVPKHLRTSKATVKKVFNTTNNINVTNNYQFNISVRQVGDYLREKLPDSEKIRILNSMDKIGEMVRQHFLFPEINRTLCVKNSNMYTGQSVCFNGKEFVTKPNKDVFEYYIMDLLDSCDYFADDFKKADSLDKSEIDRLIRNLDKYDSNIRKNDKVMRQKIQTTIAQVKDLQGKIK